MPDLNVVPEPVLLNGLKHHLGYIRQFIEEHVVSNNRELSQELLCLGESQMDVYLGCMAPEEIAREIIQRLRHTRQFDRDAFIKLLHEKHSGYATIQLSDGTDWILRLGIPENRYMHIHPGRYAHQTIRLKATALKTAIAVSIYTRKYAIKNISTEVVNLVRKEILHATPVKSISTAKGIGSLIQRIQNKDM